MENIDNPSVVKKTIAILFFLFSIPLILLSLILLLLILRNNYSFNYTNIDFRQIVFAFAIIIWAISTVKVGISLFRSGRWNKIFSYIFIIFFVLSFIPMSIFSMLSGPDLNGNLPSGAYLVTEMTPLVQNYDSIAGKMIAPTLPHEISVYRINRNFWQAISNPFPGGL